MDISDTDFEQWRSTKEFSEPLNDNDVVKEIVQLLQALVKICGVENLRHKYDGKQQIMEILNDAIIAESINQKRWIRFNFIEQEGQWDIEKWHDKEGNIITTKWDVMLLPSILKRFSRIYRHNAGDYSKGHREDVKELMGDTE